MTKIGSTIWILEPDPKLGGNVKIGNNELVAHLNFPPLLQTGKMRFEARPLHKFFELFHLMQYHSSEDLTSYKIVNTLGVARIW